MLNEIKESLVIAGIITAIIAIIFIVSGNTGSGFFSNLIIFIIGTLIGTPLAIIGKFIAKWMTIIGSDGSYEKIFSYFGFMFGSATGIVLTIILVGNVLEVQYMQQCRKTGAKELQCQCIYDKLDDKYDNLEIILNSNNKLDNKTNNFIRESANQCMK